MPVHWSGSVLQRRKEAPAHNLFENSLHSSLLPCRSLSSSRSPSSVLQPFFVTLSPFALSSTAFYRCIMSFMSPLFPAFHHTDFGNHKLSVNYGVYTKCIFVSEVRVWGISAHFQVELWITTLVKWVGSIICSIMAIDQESSGF